MHLQIAFLSLILLFTILCVGHSVIVVGQSGVSSTLLNNPDGITLDPMGNLYVADANNHRIQLFLAGRWDAITIAGIFGISGSNSTLLNQPFWVILDNQLNLIVSDTSNNRVQKRFSLLNDVPFFDLKNRLTDRKK